MSVSSKSSTPKSNEICVQNKERRASFSEVSGLIGNVTKTQQHARRFSLPLPKDCNVSYASLQKQHTITLPFEQESTTKVIIQQCLLYLFSSHILIFPGHPFKVAWDKVVLILLIYTAIEIPLKEAFDIEFSVVFDLFVTTFFLFDIWINFRTTFLDSHTHEFKTDHKIVAKKYFQTWFIIDLIASAPIAELSKIFGADYTIEKILALLHLFRVFRLGRIMSNFSTMSHQRAFLILSAIFLAFSHFGACIFHYFGDLHKTEGWLMKDNLYQKSTFKRYVSAFYWALSTITTIGYGDIHAVTFDERIFGCVMVILSAVVYSMLLAAMSLILGEIFHHDQQIAMQTKNCKEYSSKLKLGKKMTERIHMINEYYAENKFSTSISYLLQNESLPNSVKYEIIDKVLKPIVSTNQAFNLFENNLLLLMAEKLQYCVSTPNEFLFTTNDILDKVYIIQSGFVRIFETKLG